MGGILQWPGPVHEGHGKCQPFVDERADGEQREALLKIMSGQDTEPMATMFAVFASTLEKVHDPIFAKIDFNVDVEARKGRYAVAGLIESVGEPIKNPVTGAETRARIDLPNGFEYEIAEIGRSMTKAWLFPHRMAGTPFHPAGWTSAYWIIMLLMWWVMMIAMMTPSAAPMILLYARATRYAQCKDQLGRGIVPAAAFAGGYLLTWLGFSVFATLLQRGLEASGGISAMWMASTKADLSAGILMLAGIYQLSSWKHRCLNHCRNPAAFLSQHRKFGRLGAVRMGIEHGTFCVGCCWVLMALLFVGGIMNVLWIAVLATVVLLEKLAPRGPWFARLTQRC